MTRGDEILATFAKAQADLEYLRYEHYTIPHARNLPLPVISRRPSSKTIRRAACGVTSRVFATIPADTNGFAITSSTSSGSFEDVRRPPSFRTNIVRANASRSCSFRPSSAAAIRP